MNATVKKRNERTIKVQIDPRLDKYDHIVLFRVLGALCNPGLTKAAKVILFTLQKAIIVLSNTSLSHFVSSHYFHSSTTFRFLCTFKALAGGSPAKAGCPWLAAPGWRPTNQGKKGQWKI